MKSKIILTLFTVALLSTSCVSKKIFNDLENKYADLKKENRQLQDDNAVLNTNKIKLETDQNTLEKELQKTKAEREKLKTDIANSEKNLKNLQASYAALEKNSDESLQTNLNKNRELLAKLDAKEKALSAEQARINKLLSDFKERSERVAELEKMMSDKETAILHEFVKEL